MGLGGIVLAGGDVEVVARGEGHAARHEGVLLVGVVPGECLVVLGIDHAGRLARVEGSRAHLAGEDDLRGVGGPLDFIAADVGGPMDGPDADLEVGGVMARRRGVGAEPPDFEPMVVREAVDRDDRARGCSRDASHEGIDVGGRQVKVALAHVDMAGQVAARGTRLPRRWKQPFTHPCHALEHAGRHEDIAPQVRGRCFGQRRWCRLGDEGGRSRRSAHGVGEIGIECHDELVGGHEVNLSGKEGVLILEGQALDLRGVLGREFLQVNEVGDGGEVRGDGSGEPFLAHRVLQP